MTTRIATVAPMLGLAVLGCARTAPASAAAQVRPAPVQMVTTVRPLRQGAAQVVAVEVRSEIRGTLDQSARPLSFRAPITYASVPGIADRTEALEVRDRSGVVPLRVENDPVNRGGFPYYRHWRAERPVVPPVVLTYRMRPGTPRSGPQFDLYAHGGGISAGGMALFVLPEEIQSADMRVRWDLRDLANGSIAASTNGDGEFTLSGAPDQLVQAYYMAGPVGTYGRAGSGFRGFWLGTPPFEPRREMAWAERSYEYQRSFHRDASTREYRVFVRAATGAGGGTALRNSFMLATAEGDADSTKPAPRETIAHEIGHMFIGGLSGGGVGGTTWFNEGLNVYYTRLLLLRSGLDSVGAYMRSINASARAYYTNPFRNSSADSLARLGFAVGVGGGSAQNVPYTRGSLFFADVDAKIRAASGGKRRLDDVMLPLFERRRGGETLTAETLVQELVKELGPSVREHFEAVIIRGETIVPASGAFGPCFERRATTYASQGRELEGYEWARVPSVHDDRCREW